MKTEGIIKITNKRAPTSWSDFTAMNSMRKYVAEKLGRLDAATSFMYLFTRFGAPGSSNRDDGNILYHYWLRYDDLIFSIHASYYECVYFNFLFPKKYIRPWVKKRADIYREIIAKQVDKGLPVASGIRWRWDRYMSKKTAQKNDALLDAYARRFFSAQDYERLDKTPEKSWSESDWYLYLHMVESMYKDFVHSMSEEDRRMFTGYMLTVTDIPEVKDMLDKVISELKHGVWIRDVPINILGYERESNVVELNEEAADEIHQITIK